MSMVICQFYLDKLRIWIEKLTFWDKSNLGMRVGEEEGGGGKD